MQLPLLSLILELEIVITRAAPAFHKLFMVLGCVYDINTVHKKVNRPGLEIGINKDPISIIWNIKLILTQM